MLAARRRLRPQYIRRAVALGFMCLGFALVLVGGLGAPTLAASELTSECSAAPGSWGLIPVMKPVGGIREIVLTRLDRVTCDAGAVEVRLIGNRSGDPSLPVVDLGSVDAQHDPCDGQLLTRPRQMSGYSITLPTCRNVGAGAVSVVYSVTEFVITSTANAQVLGETFTQAGQSPGGSSSETKSAPSSSATLPFTGSYTSVLTRLGIWFVLLGMCSRVVGRKRRVQADSSSASL